MMRLVAACRLMPDEWCCDESTSTRGAPGVPKRASASMLCARSPLSASAGTPARRSSCARWRTCESHCV